MKIAAIILAAGQSRRFGPQNKLLSSHHGAPLLHHTLNTVLAGRYCDRILVTGHDAMHIEPQVKHLPIRTVFNPEFEDGMGTSLAAGVRALKPDCDGFMVFLADMPEIRPEAVNEVLQAFIAHRGTHSIFRPVFDGRPGHPVLFSSKHIDAIAELRGDQGAKDIIGASEGETFSVHSGDAGCLLDVDHRP